MQRSWQRYKRFKSKETAQDASNATISRTFRTPTSNFVFRLGTTTGYDSYFKIMVLIKTGSRSTLYLSIFQKYFSIFAEIDSYDFSF